MLQLDDEEVDGWCRDLSCCSWMRKKWMSVVVGVMLQLDGEEVDEWCRG